MFLRLQNIENFNMVEYDSTRRHAANSLLTLADCHPTDDPVITSGRSVVRGATSPSLARPGGTTTTTMMMRTGSIIISGRNHQHHQAPITPLSTDKNNGRKTRHYKTKALNKTTTVLLNKRPILRKHQKLSPKPLPLPPALPKLKLGETIRSEELVSSRNK